MELFKGRPLNCDDRIEYEVSCYDFLDSLSIDYWRIDHPVTNTMQECEQIDAILDASICKNLFLCTRQKNAFYLLMLRAEKQFKTKDVSAMINSSRLSFADEESMKSYLGVTPGSVSVLSLLNDTERKVTLLIDEDVLRGEFFGCHPSINTSSLKIKTADLTEKILPALKRTPIILNI